MTKWEETEIIIDNEEITAQSPIIISASRSTDIPAFYTEWMMNRLRKGYVRWTNPFNRKDSYYSFEKTRIIVFWTKNVKPLISYLKEIDNMGINYYFQFTVNDYEKEELEPNVPSLEDRIQTFKKLSDKIGKEKVIWRFDPLILCDSTGINDIKERIETIGSQLSGYTDKLVTSFADINVYPAVQKNLKRDNIECRELNHDEILDMAGFLQNIGSKYEIEIATCAEPTQLNEYGIRHNRCIDDELMIQLFRDDVELMDFLGYKKDLFGNYERPDLKDKGQRLACGCIISKDIGEYNTCGHLCKYCYANHSQTRVRNNLSQHDPMGDKIVN